VIRHGVPPFLECSSKGDRRFSAFFARPNSLHGRSIEETYQAMKVFDDGSTGLHWSRAKGRKAINQEACNWAYTGWWVEWVAQERLLPVLQAASGLSDYFGQRGSICQATVLWDIRNQIEG
jgi:hypothetical protein